MPYPSTISSFNNPLPTDRLNNPSHSSIETAQNTGLTEIQTYIGATTGANASAVGTLLYDIKAPGSDGGGHIQTANKGGTGQTSYTKGDILIAQSSSVLTKLAVGGDGQALVAASGAATGVAWGSIAGVPASVATFVPRPFVSTELDMDSPINIQSQSIASLGMVSIPVPVRTSVISIMSSDNVGPANTTADVTLYNEQGTASIFTGTSAAIDAIHTVYRIGLASVITVLPGNYYVMINSNQAGVGGVGYSGWKQSNSILSRMANITGEPVLQGTYAIAGGAPPPSIVSTAITPFTNNAGATLFFRLDS